MHSINIMSYMSIDFHKIFKGIAIQTEKNFYNLLNFIILFIILKVQLL